MYLEFMEPTVWDGVVIAVTITGLGLALLQLRKNWSAYRNHSGK